MNVPEFLAHLRAMEARRFVPAYQRTMRLDLSKFLRYKKSVYKKIADGS